MARRTDPARIVLWIQSRLPSEFNPKQLADLLKASLEEIIDHNLAYGREPITYDSVYRITEFFEKIAMREVADQFNEKGLPVPRETLDEIRKIFGDVRDELRKNFYE